MGIFCLLLSFLVIYVHFYMHIKTREEIAYKDSTPQDYLKFLIAPITYIAYTIKQPSLLKLFVIVMYISLFSFVVVWLIIDSYPKL